MRLGKSIVLSLGSVLSLSTGDCCARAQVTAQEPPDASHAQSSAPALRVYSREIIVDVVVTDSKGSPVHGLKQSDFSLLEDNKEMTPSSFEEHRSDEPPVATQTVVKQELPPNTFTDVTAAPAKAGPLTILLLDSGNTPVQDQQQIALQMLDFFNKMPVGMQIAIFRLDTHLSVLQGFTTDRELLRAAIAGKSATAAESPLADCCAGSSEMQSNVAATRARYTLTAMRELARYLSTMSGHKNLIWFSGSFPMLFPPVTDGLAFPPPCPPAVPCFYNAGDGYDMQEDLKTAADQLGLAQVAVYPIDGRGVQNLAPAPVLTGPANNAVSTGLTNTALMQMAEHNTMDQIADQTGGKAYYNTNGLEAAVEQAVGTGSNYYTLTYVTAEQKLDTRFRKIVVKIDVPDVHLQYRSGYYAVDPETDSGGKKIEKVTVSQAAMTYGAPEPAEIPFVVKVARAADLAQSLPPGSPPAPKTMVPPYSQYTVTYTIDINGIAFTLAPDHKYHADFEFGTMAYNADGELIATGSREVRPVLSVAAYRAMLKSGATGHTVIYLPAKGDYSFRIGVHDNTSDRMGVLETPVSAVQP